MALSRTLNQFLDRAHVPYDLVGHPRTLRAEDSARAAHLQGRRVAKAVLLRDRKEDRYFLAVLPATHRIHFRWLRDEFHLDAELATEQDLAILFPDCERGAVPPVGPAYRISTIWDESLDWEPEVYLEAGDHEHLVHLDHASFEQVFEGLPHGLFSREH